MAARIRSLRNGITAIDEASRDDLVATDVVVVSSLDAATTYAWALVFVPEGSSATFSGSATAVSPGSFTIDVTGAYLVRLIIDAGLATEDTQYVRLRALTVDLGLSLVAAGERRDGTGIIPVDVDTEGWANEQNANLKALEAALMAALGDVVGPASATDNAVVRFDATTGKLIQDSSAILDDAGNLSGLVNITLSGTVDGRDVAADGSALDTHTGDTGNPHSTSIANIGSGTLGELNAAVSGATLDDSSASRPPSGAAGGDLGGTYPNPTVNDGADGSAIHDNVSGEIAAIASKALPLLTDLLVIEDSAAGNAKKSVTIAAVLAGTGLNSKSWFGKDLAGSTGFTYLGGYYLWPLASFTPAGGTALGTANKSYAAHVSIVLGAASTDMVVSVTGTQIEDNGTRTPATTVLLDTTGGSTNDYYETTEKFIGQVTIALNAGTGVIVNAGWTKYWDRVNTDFTVAGAEATWLANKTNATFNVSLLHHKPTGWTYGAGGEPTPPTPLADMVTVHVTETGTQAGEYGAFKLTGISQMVLGSTVEGVLFRIETGVSTQLDNVNCEVNFL